MGLQAVLATDSEIRSRHKEELDTLFDLLRSADDFRPKDFLKAIRGISPE
jgi:hypothetical protein